MNSEKFKILNSIRKTTKTIQYRLPEDLIDTRYQELKQNIVTHLQQEIYDVGDINKQIKQLNGIIGEIKEYFISDLYFIPYLKNI